MKFKIVDLGRDWKGIQPIPDLSWARNTFLEGLGDDEYVLFIDSDEEAPRLLLDYLARLKPEYPYYNVRRIEMRDGKLMPGQNPQFKGCLLSNKVHYVGHPHEKVVPQKPCGWIDIPILHNHVGGLRYNQPAWYTARLWRVLSIILKLREIARGY